MDTVYTILTQIVAIADSLELDSFVLVMDQAIYSKEQQIRWQNDAFKERLVIRLEDFHTAMEYLGNCIRASKEGRRSQHLYIKHDTI